MERPLRLRALLGRMDGLEGCGRRRWAPSRVLQTYREGKAEAGEFSSLPPRQPLRDGPPESSAIPSPSIWIIRAHPKAIQLRVVSSREKALSGMVRFD